MIKEVINIIKYKHKYKKLNTNIYSFNIGKNFKCGNNCNISKRCLIGDDVEIGSYTYLNSSKYWITIESKVKIGKFCSIAPGVNIGAGNHDYLYVSTHPILFDPYYNFLSNKEKNIGLKDKELTTIIGNDVWIGYGAIIKRGIKIGDGAVIAAGSIVVKDVPSYSIVGGNPAKIIKYRTNSENIEYLIKNENKMFWTWNNDKLKNNIDQMYNFDVYIEMLKNDNNNK